MAELYIVPDVDDTGYIGTQEQRFNTAYIHNINSPNLTGAPTAPTAQEGTNNELVATCAFVQQELTHKLQTADYVIATYHNDDKWYRVYKSGWIEQGGRTSKGADTCNIILLKPYNDTNYSITLTTINPNKVDQSYISTEPTAEGFTITQANDSNTYTCWTCTGLGKV